MENKKRFLQIDYIKGVCILLVVVSHTIHFSKEYPYLSLWMQVVFLRGFFFSTGWIYANKDKISSIKNKGKRFIVQYALLSAIMIVLQQIISLFVGTKETYIPVKGIALLKNNILNTVTFNGVGTLWFIPILFIASACVILIIKINNEKIRYSLSFLILALGLIFHKILGTLNFSNEVIEKEMVFANRVLIAISFVMVGYLVGRLNRKMNPKKYVWLLASIIMLAAGYLAYHLTLNEIMFVLFTLSLYALMTFITSIDLFKKAFHFLEWLGQNSLYIMVIHYFVCVPIIANIFVKNELNMKSVWTRIILWAIVVVTSVLITLVIKKSKAVRFVFEQKNNSK